MSSSIKRYSFKNKLMFNEQSLLIMPSTYRHPVTQGKNVEVYIYMFIHLYIEGLTLGNVVPISGYQLPFHHQRSCRRLPPLRSTQSLGTRSVSLGAALESTTLTLIQWFWYIVLFKYTFQIRRYLSHFEPGSNSFEVCIMIVLRFN